MRKQGYVGKAQLAYVQSSVGLFSTHETTKKILNLQTRFVHKHFRFGLSNHSTIITFYILSEISPL